ncbi:hypothetical protein EDD11_004424 [Mortierella claussenii]|nr:hypothetical protein EDD11_004424 [Mortierella claussenii]
MKLHNPILLLSLSIASALVLLATVDASPLSDSSLIASSHRRQVAPSIKQLHPIQPRRKRKNNTSTAHNGLVKRAAPQIKKQQQRTPSGTTTARRAVAVPIPNTTPLLLLPHSRSVWQTGSFQTVQWSKKYSKSLPKDTTVDIILVDSQTNRKIHSLKRFVPFKKGSAQVWVPVKIPEGVSFVLVLELYRGRSQEPVTSTLATPSVAASSSSSSSPDMDQSTSLQKISDSVQDDRTDKDQSVSSASSGDVFSTIVRRSDINISPGSRRVARDMMYPEGGSSGINRGRTNGGVGSGGAGSHHDVNNNDYYTGDSTEHGLEFLPEEMREEYPNTVRPLELEHTFGLHQKVYTLTPYTLEWKIPARVAELMEYTRQVQLAASTWNKNNQGQPSSQRQILPDSLPKSTFLAKVLVELVTDQTMEPVAVLARDIPAETMFQYLSIQDRVPQAFYRLRVQMVVVEVKINDPKEFTQEQYGGSGLGALPGSTGKQSGGKGLGMEGWEFPSGGEVIDRYESITRRFWVSQGAL